MDDEGVGVVEKRLLLSACLSEHRIIHQTLLLNALHGKEEVRVLVLDEPHCAIAALAYRIHIDEKKEEEEKEEKGKRRGRKRNGKG